MPLTLVLGPANSAKAGEVLGAFAAAAPRGALLVVPTAEDAAHYARELAGEGALLGSVLTFAGLAGEVARRTGYSAWRLTPAPAGAAGASRRGRRRPESPPPHRGDGGVRDVRRRVDRGARALADLAGEARRCRRGLGGTASPRRGDREDLLRLPRRARARTRGRRRAVRVAGARRAARGAQPVGIRRRLLLRLRRPARAPARRGRDPGRGGRCRGHAVAHLRAGAGGPVGARRSGGGAAAAGARGSRAAGRRRALCAGVTSDPAPRGAPPVRAGGV